MKQALDGIEEALGALRQACTLAGDGPGGAGELDRTALLAANDALGALTRCADALRAEVAAQIDRESRPELGPDSLAKQQGFRNPAAFIAATSGITTGQAQRLIRLGRAIMPRQSLVGDSLPAKHRHVAAAVAAGSIGEGAATIIVSMLEQVAVRSDPQERDRIEQTLVEQAPGLSLDQLRRLVVHAQAWLDPDGVEPAERDRRGEEHLHLFERDGFLHIDGQIEIGRAAPVKTAIEGMVSAAFRQASDDVISGDDDTSRGVPQRQADALIALAEHALGCTGADLPLHGISVVVRMSLETLTEGLGLAEIDGIAQPVSAAAARHLAAAADIIPAVLDSKSEVMDWGRKKRLFTAAQRLALVERDGGCAMCNLPPGMTRVHHLNWWRRDHGRTNIDEGVLLCESCHHRIHDNGWDVRVEGHGRQARVWFIPPATVDPLRRPRLGGRARFQHVAA